MARLTAEVQTFIVQRLACFETPKAVADAVKETFGVTVDRRHVELYNPEWPGQKPAAKWCEVFDVARAKFLHDTSAIAITHRSYRLQELDRMARQAKARGNFPLVAQLLEQAAKECGNWYTNRRKLTHAGPDDGPIPVDLLGLESLTTDELEAFASQFLAELRGGRKG